MMKKTYITATTCHLDADERKWLIFFVTPYSPKLNQLTKCLRDGMKINLIYRYTFEGSLDTCKNTDKLTAIIKTNINRFKPKHKIINDDENKGITNFILKLKNRIKTCQIYYGTPALYIFDSYPDSKFEFYYYISNLIDI